MNRNNNTSMFVGYLVRLNEFIKENGRLNLLSTHVHAENFYRDLLNYLFGLSLSNMNEEKQNAAAIDLIDRKSKLIIQVSATCTKRKIESSLSKDIIAEYKKDGFHMKFLFIGNQNENIKNGTFLNPHSIHFNPKIDIILTNDLSSKFIDLDIDNQNSIIEFLSKELDPINNVDNHFKLSDNFIDTQLSMSLSSLGPRYTSELNVETENMLAFEAITMSEYFQKENYKYLRKIIDSIKKKSESSLESIEGKEFYRHFMNQIDLDISEINSFLESHKNFEEKVDLLKEAHAVLDNIQAASNTYLVYEADFDKKDKDSLIDYFREITINISNFNRFLDQTCYRCLYDPYLLLHGEAGIGKSHLLADMAKKKRAENHIVFLFLGQHFSSQIEPLKQLLDSLDLAGSTDQFLSTINREAERTGKRAILIIDALNEGEGKGLWKSYFQRFTDKIKQYSNISFVFSIRTPFISQLLPEGFIDINKITKFKHHGFSKEDYSPVTSFCSYYKLEEPVFPLLNPEYDNPLFLKLVCELHASLKRSSFDQNLKISNLFSFIIDDVNKKLSAYNRLDFDSNLNVIHKILEEVIRGQHDSQYREMDYMNVYRRVRKVATDYTSFDTKVLEALIQENILMDTVNYRGERIVYFAYERMGDYLLANYLLERFRTKGLSSEELPKNIREDYNINKYFNTESNISFNVGLLQALSVILADEFNIEFFEVFPEHEDNFSVMESFNDSLIWRDGVSITKTTKNYINKHIFRYKYSLDNFLNVLIQKSCLLDHPLNANTLFEILIKNPLPVRDSFWTTKISKRDINILKIINWAWENSRKIDARTVELYEITLIWTLSSTNKAIRDSSTKSLVSLFKEFPETMINMLQKFQDVDDPYILERLYAAVFGGVVRSNNYEAHPKIAKYIYNEIFCKSEVYPHVLLRDYARQTIEFILLTYDMLEIDKSKIKPPYKSKWYKSIPTNEEIDQLEQEHTKDKNTRGVYSVNRIVSSMTTEYGRGVGGYGDFGRYVLGSKVREWENQFDSDQELSNIAIKRVFEMGYDIKLHGEFDINISPHDRHNDVIERIGKKYQWIAFHELMAKLTDNFPTFEEEKIYTIEYQEYLDRKNKNLWNLIEGKEEIEEIEKEPNEEDHVIKVNKVFLPQYSGPWEPFMRDIDPTFLLKDMPTKKLELIPNQFPTNPTIEWVKNDSLYENSQKYLEFEFDRTEYIALYSHFDWTVKKENNNFNERDAKIFLASAFFVNKSKKEEVLKKRMDSINGNGLPLPNTYNIFAYEHFWSESYIDFEKERTSFEDNDVMPACHKYLWETDQSINGGNIPTYVMPSKIIVECFNLKQQTEGIWHNEDGDMICFDSALLGYDSCLLFVKDKLIQFIEESDYSLMWGVYAEKVAKKHFHEWWYTVDYDKGKFKKYISDEKNLEYRK
ncbi:NTPase [Niallia circulans]|uniref:SMEK domain-containing protein n=1 Tax=Niallia circulans TaxID=1397 RepID=UPI000F44AAAB|nr:SMEK domain-containing protein [Niallia circulans]AYV69166.1 NTPase [Niallia circulans]